MRLFGNRRKRMLGLDIGSASVKVLELCRRGGSYRVESYALEALPPNAVVERHINDVRELGEALKRARARLPGGVSWAVLALAGPAVIARNIVVQASLPDAEVERTISAEASRLIPFPLSEVAIDFEVQGLSEQHPEQADVRLVACRRDSIARIEAALAIAGLKPAVIEPESQALERVFTLLEPELESQAGELVVAVADIGATTTTVSVLVDGRSVFSRDQSFGGNCLTEAIAQHYSLSFQEAEIARRRAALPNDFATAVLQPFNEEAARQLTGSLRFFYSSTGYSDVDHLLLIGGAARAKGLAAMVEKALAVPSSVADPFVNLSLAPRVDVQALSEAAPALAVCCGLAMRGLE